MSWKEYEIEAAKFDKVPYRSQAEQFAHGMLGYISEINELNEAESVVGSTANLKEELGDMCWYIACLTRLTKHTPSDKRDYPGFLNVYNAANDIKRWLFGNKPLSETAINTYTDKLYYDVVVIAGTHDIKLEDILAANIAKLNLRTQNATKAYTEVVDESARDRAAEAKLME